MIETDLLLIPPGFCRSMISDTVWVFQDPAPGQQGERVPAPQPQHARLHAPPHPHSQDDGPAAGTGAEELFQII